MYTINIYYIHLFTFFRIESVEHEEGNVSGGWGFYVIGLDPTVLATVFILHTVFKYVACIVQLYCIALVHVHVNIVFTRVTWIVLYWIALYWIGLDWMKGQSLCIS